MARSLSGRVLSKPVRLNRTLVRPLPGTLALWTALLLALLTLLVVILSYRVRPVVEIDLGNPYDSAYLRDFHAREVDAAGTGEVFSWPLEQNSTTLPGERVGTWVAIISAAEGQPTGVLGDVTLSVNDQRLTVMQRRGQGQFLAIIPADLANSEQLRLRLEPAIVGNPDPPPGLVDQVELAPARTYRWSRGESQIVLPGLGRGAWQVDLTVVTRHPNDQPVEAQVYANDTLLAAIPDSGTARRIRLMVPPDLMDSGDLELTLRSQTFADPRPLGMFVSHALVAPLDPRRSAPLLPPWKTLLYGLTLVLSLYACLRLLLHSSVGKSKRAIVVTTRDWGSTLLPLVLLLPGGWALAVARYPTSFMLPRLALLALVSLLLILVLRPLLVWIFRAAGMPADAGPPSATAEQPSGLLQRWWLSLRRPWPWFINALLLTFFLSYWLKIGGMLYPYFVSIDVGWHMDKVRWILQGQLPLIYSTNSPLNELTMPTAEWGEAKPVIPYSPYFHMFATSFALLPWSMAFTANMFSAVIDCSRVFLIALMVRKVGLSERGALLAALLYAVLPVTFLLHSWGNIPTTFGLWWTLAATTVALVAWNQLHRPIPFIGLTLLLLGSLLFYTVTGVFMGMFVLLFIPSFWWTTGRRADAAELRVGLRPFGLAAVAALGLALLIYYGQYIWPIINQTLPYMASVFTSGPESVGVERPSFGQYMFSYVPHLDYRIWPGDYLYYGLAIPLLFTIPGFIALRNRPLLWSILAAWFTVGLFFMLVGYRISMVDKQLFYIVPAICICWAVFAERYWQRGRWGKLLIIAVYLFTLVSALDLWVIRIIRSPMT
jgi:hypothetical protein